MSGQAATLSRDEVRSAIRKADCSKKQGGSKAPKLSMKTTAKQ